MRSAHSLNGPWQAAFVEPGIGDDRRLFVEPLAVEGWFEALVPGDVHTDLHRLGHLPDPYIADNLEACRWTQTKECWLYRYFRVPDELAGLPALELVLDGIDTVGEVWINDHYLGRVENMFRQYRFDIGGKLAANGTNQLTVKIFALDEARKPYRGQRDYRAIKDQTRIYFRKPQCQFGWDWSPEFGSLGIWGDVRLEANHGVRIDSVQVETKCNGEVIVYTTMKNRLRDGEVEVHIEGHGADVRHVRALDGVRTFAALQVPEPQLWWPNGYGEQPMYTCTVEVRRGDRVIDRHGVRFGIREVSHAEERVSNDEVSWQLKVNGRTVFCQGANWVPPDMLPGAMTRERYDALLGRVREAGFNMLRIWGGGLYESDRYYELCDDYGIMVWQDFAFANADYPLDREDWRRNVTAEIEYQVCRLRNHPSLTIWCGGNEKSSSFEIEHAIDDGFDLFGVHIPGLLNLLDRTRPYIISSPIAYTDIGNDRSSGNSHTSVWLWAYFDNINVEPFREYLNPPPAFKSEFFLQGAPRFESFRKLVGEENLWPPNDVWAYKFRGAPEWDKGRMVSFHEYQMNTIEKFFGRPDNLADFLKTSAFCHRELAREEFEHTRCHRRRCGGSLFWMMNDTWPAPTWALVDFFGVPKPVFYALKRACAPLGAYMTVTGEDHEAFVVNDTGQPAKGTLRIAYREVDGKTLDEKKVEFEVAAHDAVSVFAIKRDAWREPNGYVHLDLEAGERTFEHFYYPALWKGMRLQDPQLQMDVSEVTQQGDRHTASVTLRGKHYARCVYLDLAPLEGCEWEDNFFDMAPGGERTVRVWSPRAFTARDITLGHWLTDWTA